jgi:N-acetylglucosamine kinase-like BadF-type ATPase
MGRYILGIDGGGTKSQCALFTVQGERVDLLNWGTTNHECLPGGMKQLPMELNSFIDAILKRNNIGTSDIEYAVFGLAGVDTRMQHRHISKMLAELGFRDFLLCNDSYLGIKGGVRDGFGICVINGTGCTVTGLNSKGTMLQIGGQGILTGDLGGAGSLGGMAVTAAYSQAFKFGTATIITDLMFQQLNITDKYMFLETLTDKIASGDLLLPELNRLVFDAAAKGDNRACQILKEVGEDIGNSVNGMIAELFKDETHVEVVLAGSLNVKERCSVIQETLISKVVGQNPGIHVAYSVLQHPTVAGAVIWALSHTSPGIDAFQKVRSQF